MDHTLAFTFLKSNVVTYLIPRRRSMLSDYWLHYFLISLQNDLKPIVTSYLQATVPTHQRKALLMTAHIWTLVFSLSLINSN